MDVLWKVSKLKFLLVALIALLSAMACNVESHTLKIALSMLGSSVVAALIASYKENDTRAFLESTLHRSSYAILVSIILFGVASLLGFIEDGDFGLGESIAAAILIIIFLFATPLAAIEKLMPFKAFYASLKYWIPDGFIVLLKSLAISVIFGIAMVALLLPVRFYVPDNAGNLLNRISSTLVGAFVLFYMNVLIHIDHVEKGSVLLHEEI